jgi:hypothetical protein
MTTWTISTLERGLQQVSSNACQRNPKPTRTSRTTRILTGDIKWL